MGFGCVCCSHFFQEYDFTSEDLEDQGEIGRGAYGTVNKMYHRASDKVMAVKVCYLNSIKSKVKNKKAKKRHVKNKSIEV